MKFELDYESDYSTNGSSESKDKIGGDEQLNDEGARGVVEEGRMCSRLRKPTTHEYFRKTVFCKRPSKKNTESKAQTEHKAIQSMYLAAIEPEFNLTANYKRIAMQRSSWEQFFMAYELAQSESNDCSPPFWFRSDVSESLVSYWDAILSELGVDHRTSSSFFALVPLCGHSHDLTWLYRQGVCVTGVDFCLLVVETFVRENPSLGLQRMEMSDGTEYFITPDRRLRIFVDDFFSADCYMDQQYNFVWDRCSFTCINIDQRKAYARQIMKCRAEIFCMLLETYEYEPPTFALLPHPSYLFEQQELFGMHLQMKTSVIWQNKINWDGERTFEFLKPFVERSIFKRRTSLLSVKLRVTMYIR